MDLTEINSEHNSPSGGGGGGSGNGSGPDLAVGNTTEPKKRNRIRFSCTSCREKKLKCNRQSPCDQCEKRQLTASCTFIPYVNPRPTPPGNSPGRHGVPPGLSSAPPAHRGKGPGGDSAMQARLKHLEHIVQVLKHQKRDASEPAQPTQEVTADDEPLPGLCKKKLAGIITDGQRYVEAADWESILDDITKLTSDLKATITDESPVEPDFPPENPQLDRKAPVLLTGGFPYVTVAEMISRLPPRSVVDRLVARFFQIKEPAWMLFHLPSFLEDYEGFWEDHSRANYTCLSLFFAVCANAVLGYQAANEEVPGNLGPPDQVFQTFKTYAAQCLALGDYTKPGPWKVESLILYFSCEYLEVNDSSLGISILVSIMVRLAMHMGMHRDPKHYPNMTPFEGEMRRRVWALVVETDQLVSFQFGLPSNMPLAIADTELPRNLHDDDFGRDTKELPPSRPETERTVALYTIVKARIMRAFGDITSTLNNQAGFTYSTLARLDKQLEEAHNSFPSILRYRPFGHSLVDPIDLIMQRYWLELLYQKSRTILHRQFIVRGRTDKRFEYSRKACLDAATQTLKYQYDIHCETQQGGRLAKDRGMITSLSIHDFLLADMILCLELSFIHASKKKRDNMPCEVVKMFEGDSSSDILSEEQIMQILETSRSIWQSMRKDSAEANKGFKILTKMLRESTGAEFVSSPESMTSSAGQSVVANMPSYPPPFHFGADTGSDMSINGFEAAGTGYSPNNSLSGSSSLWNPSAGFQTDNGATGQTSAGWPQSNTDASHHAQNIMDGMVEASLTGDWSIWDTQIHKSTLEGCQIPWHSFFQANDP